MLLRPLASLDLADMDVEIPTERGLIIVANHRSVMDILVGLAIFRRWDLTPRMFVNARFFAMPGVGLLLRLLRAIPASRETARAAIQTALGTLAQGGVIALAPEGRVPRAEDRMEGVSDLRSGVGRLAVEFGTPVIILGITNTDIVWPLDSRLPRIRICRVSRPVVKVEVALLDIAQGSAVAQVMAQLRDLLSQMIVRAEAHQQLRRPSR